jgi:O-antigen/teichoic acid export membrane protein
MLILSPIFTFYLSKSEFGSYDLIITTISLLYPLLSLQISDSIYRFMLNANPKTQIEVFSNGFIVTIIQFVLFFIVFSLLKLYFKIDYFYYLALLMFGFILFPFMQQTLRGLKLNKLYAVIGIINAFSLLIFCLIFLVFFKMKISGVLISTIISYFLVVFIAFYYGKLYKLFSFQSFRFQTIKDLCVYSIPLKDIVYDVKGMLKNSKFEGKLKKIK